MATHLQYKKDRLRKAYEKRLAAYNAAIAERARLKARGDTAGAAAVTLKNNKKPQKTRPKQPAILKDAPFMPPFYRYISILPTNFLIADMRTGRLTPQKLVQCKLCNVMANVRYQQLPSADQATTKPNFPDLMLCGLLDEHEAEVHYAREGDMCLAGCNVDEFDMSPPPLCETCLNAEALATKAELVATGGWDY